MRAISGGWRGRGQREEVLGRKQNNPQPWGRGGDRSVDGGILGPSRQTDTPNIWSFLLNHPVLLQDGRETHIYSTQYLLDMPELLH